jgi:signal transduction histidine kinase/DNA-binding response OmpR family regulator
MEKTTGETPDFIISDDEGNIRCGFAGGIALLSEDGKRWQVARFGEFDKSKVLSMEQVGDMIWAGTADGVWAVGKDMKPIRLNLRADPYTCIFHDKNSGTVYLGGVDEIVETTPDIIHSGQGISSIVITGFSVNDKPCQIPLTSVRYTGRYKLKYNQNHLYFEFSTLSYSQEEKSRFICRMEGVDRDWNLLPQNSNHVSYANLKYGNYSFKVNTLDVNGHPGPSPKTVFIRISPPWYYTSIAKICYAAFILGLVIWIMNFFRVKNRLRIERIEKDKTLEQAKLKMDFFANLSHEFKTPLSMILAPADKLLSEIKDRRQAGQLETIRQNAVKLDTLIHKALDFNRMDDNPDDLFIPSKVEMVEFCKSIISVYKDNFEDRTFIFEARSETIYTSVDPVKMESVLNNVISNACKYTPPGGSVKFGIGYSDDGSKIDISISDDGVGIPPNEIPYVFQRFFQSSRTAGKKGGTGIGLYLAKCYVEMHNGTISAASGKDGGTVISITLPARRQEDIGSEGLSEGHPSPMDGNHKKIAVIDDNIAITEFIKDTLGGEYDCEIAHNGKAGLTLCREMMPDLIIADLMMPVMDGLEMCRRIKKDGKLSLVPIILLTAKTDSGTELESINLNIDVFMPKPFDASILLSRVRQLLDAKEQVESKLRIEKISTPEKVEMMSYDEKLLSDITRIIEDNMPEQTLNVEFLSDKANVSQKQLYRKIRLLTGVPPVEYIRQIRMKKAAMLLRQKRFTISEVMYMVGFSSSSYFSKCFQNQFGISPKQFSENEGADT